MAKKKPDDNPVLATNKKAFHDYNILERFEAGIKLVGTEVKSCRERAVVISDGYVKIQNGNAMLLCTQIWHYGYGNRFNHDMRQPRQLLLHKREILKLSQWLGSKGGDDRSSENVSQTGAYQSGDRLLSGKNARRSA